jgi:hypothetical protein
MERRLKLSGTYYPVSYAGSQDASSSSELGKDHPFVGCTDAGQRGEVRLPTRPQARRKPTYRSRHTTYRQAGTRASAERQASVSNSMDRQAE